jgi:hypothetical protein
VSKPSQRGWRLSHINQSGSALIYGDVSGDRRVDFSVRIDKTIGSVRDDFILQMMARRGTIGLGLDC